MNASEASFILPTPVFSFRGASEPCAAGVGTQGGPARELSCTAPGAWRRRSRASRPATGAGRPRAEGPPEPGMFTTPARQSQGLRVRPGRCSVAGGTLIQSPGARLAVSFALLPEEACSRSRAVGTFCAHPKTFMGLSVQPPPPEINSYPRKKDLFTPIPHKLSFGGVTAKLLEMKMISQHVLSWGPK